jgi:hypothetical protein
MPNTAAEPIQVGAFAVRFHVDADELVRGNSDSLRGQVQVTRNVT